MNRIFLLALLLACAPLWLSAQDQADPEDTRTAAEKVAALEKAYRQAQQDFRKAYQAAKTQEEKDKLFKEKRPQFDEWAGRFLAVARAEPETPGGCQALIWVVFNKPGRPNDDQIAALELLQRHHLESVKLERTISSLIYTPSLQTQTFLKAVIAKNPHKKIKGSACYTLGKLLARTASLRQRLENADEATLAKFKKDYGGELIAALQKTDVKALEQEAEKCLKRVIKDYGELKPAGRMLGDAAKGDLYEMRNLAVGKVAPDIEGADLNGVHFKLSNYRGKVVMLGFWGHW